MPTAADPTFTPARKLRFLGELARHGNVRVASARCGVSRSGAYLARARDAVFAVAWRGALVLGRDCAGEEIAVRGCCWRILPGTIRPAPMVRAGRPGPKNLPRGLTRYVGRWLAKRRSGLRAGQFFLWSLSILSSRVRSWQMRLVPCGAWARLDA